MHLQYRFQQRSLYRYCKQQFQQFIHTRLLPIMGNKDSTVQIDAKAGPSDLGSIFSPDKADITSQGCWPKLSYKERAIGWIACSAVGWILSLIASFTLVFSDDMVPFAIMYSVGQVINIVGSCFLSTPKGQWKAMKKKERRIASIIYVSSIVATMVVALATNIKGLVFLFMFIQMAAYYWYTITFIPYGQTIVKKCCTACLS